MQRQYLPLSDICQGAYVLKIIRAILRLSEDLPVIVEIADSLENIERFLPTLDEMIKDGLVTLEEVRVIQYKG